MGKYADIVLAASKNKRISLRTISTAVGKNNAYMQQFYGMHEKSDEE